MSSYEGGEAGALQYAETKRLAMAGGRAMLVRHVVFALVSLAGSALLLRALGPEQWASYSVAYFLVVVFDNALGANVLGWLVRSPERPDRRHLEAAVALMFFVGISAVVLFAAASVPVADLYGRSDLAPCLAAVGVCVFVYTLRAPSVALLERDLRYRSVAAAELIDQLTFYVLALTLLELGAGLPGVAAALALRGVVAAIFLRRRQPTPVRGRLHPDPTRELLKFGTPTLGTTFLILVTGLIPALVLGGDHAEELGFVMMAGTIVGYAATGQVILQRVGFPSFASLAGDAVRVGATIARTVRLSNTLALSLLVPLGGLAPVWLPALLGTEWERAVPVVVAMAAAFAFQGAISIGTAALQSLNHQTLSLRLHLAATAVYAVLGFALVGESALLGVPIAFVASRVVGMAVAMVLLSRVGQPVVPFGEVLVLPLAVGVMIAVSALLDSGYGYAAVGLFAVFALLWGVGRRADLALLRAAMHPPRLATGNWRLARGTEG
jgi:O-antigen/teichoic acid export membrane protein